MKDIIINVVSLKSTACFWPVSPLAGWGFIAVYYSVYWQRKTDCWSGKITALLNMRLTPLEEPATSSQFSGVRECQSLQKVREEKKKCAYVSFVLSERPRQLSVWWRCQHKCLKLVAKIFPGRLMKYLNFMGVCVWKKVMCTFALGKIVTALHKLQSPVGF